MIDAASRASARRITAVIPYFGYARQDRKDQPRVALTSKLIANLLTSSGVDRVITMDLHASQIQGFFDIPMDHLYGSYVFAEYFRRKAITDLVVASPDIGSLRVARSYAKRLRAGLALVDKRRPKPNEVEVLNVIGEVKDKNILFVDDLIDTAGTLTTAAEAMKAHGANDIYVACTHALLSGKAIERITNSPIKEMTVTDSIKIADDKKIPKLKILTVSSLFAQAIDRIHNEKSISILFDVEK
jgi:ribose-phosphate pyrophosphokinase